MKIEEKFLEAYDQHAEAILRHIFFRVSDQALAEDLAQETFFKAWRNIAEGEKEIGNFKSFFYKIANNLIIDHYRRKPRQPVALETVEENKLSCAPEQVAAAEKTLDRQMISRLIGSLDEDYRQVLLYRYVDDLSIKEISGIVGKTPNNISVMIHRGLNMLRDKINVQES